MPTVSVIIPVFNKAQFLVCCIESVLSQTYKDFELILIDDGSTDESLSICQKYAEFNSSVKVYHQENAGASAARNYGIDIAQGKWCSFIDADDFVKSNYLSDLVDHITSESCLVMSNMEYGQGIIVPDYIDAECVGIDEIREYIWNNSIASHLGPCVKLFNRAILNESHIRFPKDVSNGEDTIFVFDYLSKVNVLSVFESRNYVYRYVAGSLSNKCLSEKKSQNNYSRLKDTWLSFIGLPIEDSRVWINSPLPAMLNLYVLSLFADRQLSFSYRVKQVKTFEKELMAMYKHSEISVSNISRLSVLFLGLHLYILYIMCYFVFVRYHLKLNVG